MKKIIIYSLLISLIIACGTGGAKYQSQLESLNSDWNEINQGLTNLTGLIQQTHNKWEVKLNNMSLTDEIKDRISAEHLQQLDSLKTTYADFGPQLDGMSKEIQEFAGQIATDQNQVETWTVRLKEGNMEGDFASQMDQMKETIKGAKEKMDNWEATYAAVEEELSKIANDRADLLQAVL